MHAPCPNTSLHLYPHWKGTGKMPSASPPEPVAGPGPGSAPAEKPSWLSRKLSKLARSLSGKRQPQHSSSSKVAPPGAIIAADRQQPATGAWATNPVFSTSPGGSPFESSGAWRCVGCCTWGACPGGNRVHVVGQRRQQGGHGEVQARQASKRTAGKLTDL